MILFSLEIKGLNLQQISFPLLNAIYLLLTDTDEQLEPLFASRM